MISASQPYCEQNPLRDRSSPGRGQTTDSTTEQPPRTAWHRIDTTAIQA